MIWFCYVAASGLSTELLGLMKIALSIAAPTCITQCLLKTLSSGARGD